MSTQQKESGKIGSGVRKRDGESTSEPKATIPKTSTNETPIRIEEGVITKRKKAELYALKLRWSWAKEGSVI